MKKILLIILFSINLVSCTFTIRESRHYVIIVSGCTNTKMKDMTTVYQLSVYGDNGTWTNVIEYQGKIGMFEVGDTLVFTKK